MRSILSALTLGTLLVAPVVAMGSDYADFNKDLSLPYSHYKKSLSLTSKKEDADKAKVAIAAFTTEWGKLAAKYSKDVPDVFASVKDFPALIARPVAVGTEARELMEKGDVKTAHNLLEEVRYLMWNLRVTNGIVALADKANNFHEAMEIILDKADEAKDANGLRQVEARFGPWLMVAWEEVALAPESALSSVKTTLVEGRASVAALRTALKNGDRAAIKQQGTAVKNAYKKIFFMD
jgi:hypothetical protein